MLGLAKLRGIMGAVHALNKSANVIQLPGMDAGNPGSQRAWPRGQGDDGSRIRRSGPRTYLDDEIPQPRKDEWLH
jgi:hypothetical protein